MNRITSRQIHRDHARAMQNHVEPAAAARWNEAAWRTREAADGLCGAFDAIGCKTDDGKRLVQLWKELCEKADRFEVKAHHAALDAAKAARS